MKGIVFSEFLELVESKFGVDTLDDIIEDCDGKLSSNGAYTAVGTYNHEELIALVSALSARTELPINALVHTFGLHLAEIFAQKFPTFFSECTDTFQFLKKIDDHIHVEVKKLYPDAELPTFHYDHSDNNVMTLRYQSNRHFSDLAHGLIEGVGKYYGEAHDIGVTDNSSDTNADVTFVIKKK
jgi:hypothetical protein